MVSRVEQIEARLQFLGALPQVSTHGIENAAGILRHGLERRDSGLEPGDHREDIGGDHHSGALQGVTLDLAGLDDVAHIADVGIGRLGRAIHGGGDLVGELRTARVEMRHAIVDVRKHLVEGSVDAAAGVIGDGIRLVDLLRRHEDPTQHVVAGSLPVRRKCHQPRDSGNDRD